MRLDHVNIVVSDMERSLRFYEEDLGMKRGFETVLEGEWIDRVTGLSGVRARCVFVEFPDGGPRIELLEYAAPKGSDVAENRIPNTIGARHIAIVVSDPTAVLDRLRRAGAPIVSEPVTVPFAVGALGRKQVCYFLDPDGVLLEIASYEVHDSRGDSPTMRTGGGGAGTTSAGKR